MDKRKRITNILVAGTLTIVVLTVFLAFRGGDEMAALDVENSVDTSMVEMVGEYETDIAALQAQIENLQTQNAAFAQQNEELRAAVTTLQERESEYQTQIEAANQTIAQLSPQGGTLALGGQPSGDQPFGDQQFGDQPFGELQFGEQQFGEPLRRPHEHNH